MLYLYLSLQDDSVQLLPNWIFQIAAIDLALDFKNSRYFKDISMD